MPDGTVPSVPLTVLKADLLGQQTRAQLARSSDGNVLQQVFHLPPRARQDSASFMCPFSTAKLKRNLPIIGLDIDVHSMAE